MILSQRQIEEIAAAVMQNFNDFFFGNEEFNAAHGTPIDQFAKDYLGLSVSFTHLSTDGSILGLTAYDDTEYIIEEKGVRRSIPLKRNQVLMDNSFIMPGQVRQLCGKRRFTLAHECAHQILFQMENDNVKKNFRKMYAARTAYSLRELKTHEDWNEWQANALGAAILMPQKEIDLAMRDYANGKQLVCYEWKFGYHDRFVLGRICQLFGVSKSAAIIRLRQLGYIEDRSFFEYVDPLEVWA